MELTGDVVLARGGLQRERVIGVHPLQIPVAQLASGLEVLRVDLRPRGFCLRRRGPDRLGRVLGLEAETAQRCAHRLGDGLRLSPDARPRQRRAEQTRARGTLARRPDAPTRTVYVQQQQVPGGWDDHAATEDRALALARYKSFAREKGTRLIERTERVLVEGLARKDRK